MSATPIQHRDAATGRAVPGPQPSPDNPHTYFHPDTSSSSAFAASFGGGFVIPDGLPLGLDGRPLDSGEG